MAGEHGVGPALVDDVAGVVVVLQDLLEDDLALDLDVVGGQRRVQHSVAQQLEPEGGVVGQQSHEE